MIRTYIIFLCVMGGGCSLAPRKECPVVCLPASYQQEKEVIQEGSLFSLENWWEQFQDPFLDTLILEAREKNFDLRTVAEKIEQSRASITAASAKLLPYLDFFGTAARLKTSKDLLPLALPGILPKVQNFFLSGFDAVWEWDFWGKNQNSKKQAWYQSLAIEQQAKYVELSLVAEVARLYTQIRTLQEKTTLVQKKVSLLQKLYAVAVILEETGLQDALYVEKYRALLAKEASELPLLEEGFQQNLGNLSVLLGGEVGLYEERFRRGGNIPYAKGKIPIGLPSDLLQRRPDIQQAEWNVYACGAGVGIARAELFPSFALTGLLGSSSRVASHLLQPHTGFWAAVPTVDWSLFQGGSALARVKIANSLQKTAVISYEKVVKTALNEVENALVGYAQTSVFWEEIENIYQAQKTLSRLSHDRFRCGLSDIADLWLSYEKLLNAKIDYIDAKGRTMLYLISVYKALGGGVSTKDISQDHSSPPQANIFNKSGQKEKRREEEKAAEHSNDSIQGS